MAQSRKTGRAGIDKRTAKTLGADALVEAVNVLVEGDGQLRQRPGFTTETIKSTSRRPRRVFPDGLILSDSSNDEFFETTTGTVTGNNGTGQSANLGSSYNLADFVRARQNLYVTTYDGVRKRTSTADTTLERAGICKLNTGTHTLSSTAAAAVANNKAVAYRWVINRTDANGMTVTSEPTSWYKVVNTSGGTRNVVFTIYLAADHLAGDIVELYRSLAVPNTDTPSDELYLCYSHTVTSTNVSNAYVTITDVMPEAQLGRALYTNGTREGILKANARPPLASTMATWQDCVWMNAHLRPATQAFSIINVDNYDSTALYSYFNAAATTTSGSPTLDLGASAWLSDGQPRAGMRVWEVGSIPTAAGTAIPANTTVLAVVGNTVTMSANATASVAGTLAVYMGDYIDVNGYRMYAVKDTQTSALAGNNQFSTLDTSGALNAVATAKNLAYAVQVAEDVPADSISDDVSDAGTVLIEAEGYRETLTDVASSAPASISSIHNTAGDDARNTVAYSKPMEPEHFPALNFLAFGSESNQIIKLTALDDALLVWTLEGLYRVSGSAPDSWRVDLLDSNLILLRGEMVDVMSNRAWALTNRGLVSAGAGGVEAIVSGKVARDLEKYIEAALSSPSTHTDNMFVCCWPSAGAVIVGVSDSPSSIAGTGFVNHFVYQPELDAWTRWDTGGSSATATGGAKWMTRLYPTESIASLAVGAQWRYREGRYGKSGTSDLGIDKTYTLTGAWSNVGGSTYAVRATVANCNGWVAKVGDWVSATLAGNTVYRRVLTVVDIATYNSVTLDGPIDMAVLTGSATCKAYDGIPITLTYHSAADGPAIARECQVGFDISDLVTADAFGTYTDAASATEQTPINMRLLVGAGTEMTELARSTELSTPRMTSPASRSTPYTTTIRERWGTTRATARAQHFYPSIWLSEAFCRKLAVLPLVVIYEPAGMKGYYR